MLPTVADVLALPPVHQGRPVVRAGAESLDRPVRWVHVAEVSDIAHLLEGGELILTTGIGLPGDAEGLRRYIAELHAVDAAALVIELGRRYRSRLPDDLVDAAADAGLPLVELHRESRFVAVTQAVHTVILEARMQEDLTQQTHRTLLTALALSSAAPAGAAARAAALGLPLDRRPVVGLVVRSTEDEHDAALLRDLASQAVTTLRALGVAALVGPLDDQRVAVLFAPGRGDAEQRLLAQLAAQLHAGADRRGADVAIGVGRAGLGPEGAQLSLREALQVADTARALPRGPDFRRSSDLRLRGLAHALRDHPALREFADRELGLLIAHDERHGTRLTEFLAAFCRAGGHKTAAADALFISRAALYDRIAKAQRVLGVDLGDPEALLSLHFALLVHETTSSRPSLALS